MKTKILLLALIILPILSHAQLTKGSKEFSISLGLSLYKASYPNSGKNTVFSVALPIRNGWLVKDNLSVGYYLSPSYSHSKDEFNSIVWLERESYMITGGVYLRKYFSVGRFSPFIESKILYGRGKTKEEDRQFGGSLKTESDTETIGMDMMFGTLFKISDTFAFEASFNPFFNVNYTSSGNVDNYGIDISPRLTSMNIGARFTL